jgi:hypothetical protein
LICWLDLENVGAAEIVRRLHEFDPELRKDGRLTPEQIDKRLRILDQMPELNYWSEPYIHKRHPRFGDPRDAYRDNHKDKSLEGSH